LRAIWIGLFLSLFAMVAIRYAVVYFAYEITFGWAILKETLMWVSAVALLIIIRRAERLPFSSIGLGTLVWWKSVVWGLATALVLALVVGGLAYLTGWRHGPGSAVSEKLPLWLITLIVFRAGIVEELFYRGYAIERLQVVGLGRFWLITISLVVFSFAHWSEGAANVLIALAAGAILTGFDLWRRDLVANMIGHCLVSLL
jgi:membrane protease YdiL (CAAX protease family)